MFPSTEGIRFKSFFSLQRTKPSGPNTPRETQTCASHLTYTLPFLSQSQLYRAGCFLSGSTEEDLLPMNLLPVSPASLGKPNFAPFCYQLVPASGPGGPAALSWTSQKGNFLPITPQARCCGTINSPTLICCPWPHNVPKALLTGRQSVEMLLTWAVQPRNQKEDFSFLFLPPVKALKQGCLATRCSENCCLG